MGDDDVRFVIDLGEKPTNTASRSSAKSNAKPVPRDQSFQISGGVSDPTLQTSPAPAFTPSPTERATAGREPLLHIALRIPRKLLNELDEMARQDRTSLSAIIRESLRRTARNRRRKSEVTHAKD